MLCFLNKLSFLTETNKEEQTICNNDNKIENMKVNQPLKEEKGNFTWKQEEKTANNYLTIKNQVQEQF